MTERDQTTNSPLRSDRGHTVIDDTVVSRIAGMAAGKTEGLYLGGSTARTAGDFIDRIRGSQSETRGISVEVGQEEVAIDLTVGTEYGKNIVEVTEAARRAIVERVETITGLRVTEMNITIDDIVFPSEEEKERREKEARREASRRTDGYSGSAAAEERGSTGTAEEASEPQEQTTRESQTGSTTEEEVRAETIEETAVAEDETAEINLQGEEIHKHPEPGEDEGGRRSGE